MTDSILTSDGIRIAYRVDDFTPPWRKPQTLLMLHSMLGSGRRYHAWVPELARRFRVVRVDMRGHGDSEVPSPSLALSPDRLRRDIVEVLDALDVAQAHVVGYSAGGYVSQHLAMDSPERVRSLMLFGSTPGLAQTAAGSWIPKIRDQGLEHFVRVTIAARYETEHADPAMVEWLNQDALRNDPDFICRWLGMFSALDWSESLKRVQCPTLIVRPGHESVGTVGSYDVMLRNIADAELLTYQGVPHNVADFMPQQCVADVLSFLTRRFPVA